MIDSLKMALLLNELDDRVSWVVTDNSIRIIYKWMFIGRVDESGVHYADYCVPFDDLNFLRKHNELALIKKFKFYNESFLDSYYKIISFLPEKSEFYIDRRILNHKSVPDDACDSRLSLISKDDNMFNIYFYNEHRVCIYSYAHRRIVYTGDVARMIAGLEAVLSA